VRNHVVSNIDLVADAIGLTGLQNSILPAFLELWRDPKWRVRLEAVSKCALFSRHLGVQVFEKRLKPIVITALSDHVFAIRERCCLQVGEIVSLYGKKWAAEKLFPEIFAMYNKATNYLHRMTCLLVVQSCAAACAPDVVEANLFPLVLQACSDEVPNVRMLAAKTCKYLLKYSDAAVLTKMKPELEKLTRDSDVDAAFFATEALHLLK